jgi:hypothetical protein
MSPRAGIGEFSNEREKGPGSICSGILRFMPRRPRIHLAGVPLYSVQRGHNREACFFGEEDYLAYRHGLGEALNRERLRPARLRVHDQPCACAADSTAAPKNVPRLIISLGGDATCGPSTKPSPHRHAVRQPLHVVAVQEDTY